MEIKFNYCVTLSIMNFTDLGFVSFWVCLDQRKRGRL